MKDTEYKKQLEIYEEAALAASIAANAMVATNPGVWYPCGFSSVRIRPARGKFVTVMKDQGIGRTDDFEGGYVFSNPSRNLTQWMDAKIEGSKAFAKVLEKHGIKAIVQSRMD